jgi:hypothetical protein
MPLFQYIASSFLIFTTISLQAFAGETQTSFSVIRNGDFIDVSESNGIVYKCKNSEQFRKDEEIESPIITNDRKAVIFSTRHFSLIDELKVCTKGHIKLYSIPPKVGELQDVNVAKKIYLAIDIIGVHPISFLAVVANWNSSRNLINLPGAYIFGRSLKELQKSGFSYSQHPKISENGRYISPSGDVMCGVNDYPGIWDMETKKRVVFADAYSNAVQSKCEKLFE